jgi:amino acid transporter
MNRPNEQDRPTTSDTLHRSLSVWNNLTIGFAVVSPVVGLYAIIGVQTVVTGGSWFAALALCLVMQLLVATVYAELTSQFPIGAGRTSGHGSSEGASPDNSPESSTSVPQSLC